MKTKTRCLMAAAAGCTILLASCAPNPMTTTHVAMSTSSSGSSDHADNSLAGKVYAQVNDYRISSGKDSMERSPTLDRMAQQHSEYMMAHRGTFQLSAGVNVSHIGFEDRALYVRRAMNMESVAENVAAGPWAGAQGPAQMVRAWEQSPGHNANLKGLWTTTGVGVAVDKDGTVFATQLFANKSTSLMSMSNRMKGF